MKIVLLLLILLYWGVGRGQKKAETILLNQNWYFAQDGKGDWLEAEVPGTIHQDLIRHQLLPDPFYGINEEKIQWVEDKDWEYKTVFIVTEEQLGRDAAILNLKGLDTYADVYLNGALILQSDNMFVGHQVPVKDKLRKGENYLHVYFHSPIKQTLPQWRSNGFNYPADNDHRAERLSVFTRKAPYSYGWDWGIRMVTCGIWRPVVLTFQDVVSIEDFYVQQLELKTEKAVLVANLQLKSLTTFPRTVKVKVSCTTPAGKHQSVEQEMILKNGEEHFHIPVEIQHPELWMPNGWGKPALYNFRVQIDFEGLTVAEQSQRIGLRTIRVVQEKDSIGESFYFEVNGVPMFAKGANYIPADAMLPAITTARYETLFRDIREANMNMIRVWGGGTYEDDRFYELADENGILIWQDFMFGCTTYPADAVFLRRVEEEAAYNIRRLRHHACLAMWCGNNEIKEGLLYWGWKKKYGPEIYQEMCEGYERIFEQLLPAKVKELDSGRFYMHGSPYFANWGRPESWKVGDSHNWGVWYGRKPFESLDAEIPRFMSEFGFQSFPEMKTIASFAAEGDYQLESQVMNAHQKSTIGNALIRTYMERDYILPNKFEDFVYIGLVMQGHGIRRGLEAHRRNRPYCMGTLYWQLNDSWPVVSWSGIDYFGNWKALHYQAKRAFAPLKMNAIQVGDSLQIWLLSDRLEKLNGLTLELQRTDFYGKVQKKQVIRVEAAANCSRMVHQMALSDWGIPGQTHKCYLLLTLKDKAGKKIDEEPYFFSRPRELDLPQPHLHWQVKTMDGQCEVTLSSRELVKDVFVEVPAQGARFSDNFFDLLPGTTRKITITSALFQKGKSPGIKIKHLKSIY